MREQHSTKKVESFSCFLCTWNLADINNGIQAKTLLNLQTHVPTFREFQFLM